MIYTNVSGVDGARVIAEALGGSVLDPDDKRSWWIEMPGLLGQAWVSPASRVTPEYSHILSVRPSRLDTTEEIDAYAREMYERLCEATPWRIGLMPDGGDIIDERPALNAG